MIIALFSAALGIALFLCFYLAFRTGLRLGMVTGKGELPKPIKGPIKALQEHKENVKAATGAQKSTEEWQEIENYDGWTEEERKLINKG